MQITRENVSYTTQEVPNTLGGFKNWEFTSGPTTDVDFKVFARLFRKQIQKSLPPGAELVNASNGHYYISGFVKRDSNFVYFSISDVRYFPGEWYKNILVRTAKHEKDYTGGSNRYTTLENFTNDVDRLLNQ